MLYLAEWYGYLHQYVFRNLSRHVHYKNTNELYSMYILPQLTGAPAHWLCTGIPCVYIYIFFFYFLKRCWLGACK